MADYKLSFIGKEVDEKLAKIEELAEKVEAPITTSQLINDAGFVTEKDISNKNFITIDIDS